MIIRRPVAPKSLALRRFPYSLAMEHKFARLRIVRADLLRLGRHAIPSEYPILDARMNHQQSTAVEREA